MTKKQREYRQRVLEAKAQRLRDELDDIEREQCSLIEPGPGPEPGSFAHAFEESQKKWFFEEYMRWPGPYKALLKHTKPDAA